MTKCIQLLNRRLNMREPVLQMTAPEVAPSALTVCLPCCEKGCRHRCVTGIVPLSQSAANPGPVSVIFTISGEATAQNSIQSHYAWRPGTLPIPHSAMRAEGGEEERRGGWRRGFGVEVPWPLRLGLV